MNKLFIFVVLALLLGSGSGQAQLPPLIDREIFFGDPEISGAQISPDGKYISFVKPFRDVRNIWVKERTAPFDAARPITADTVRPVVSYFWSRDSRYILYAQDKGGDENFRIYAVDPGTPGNPVLPARDLTPLPNVRAMIYAVPKKTPNEIIIGLNERRSDLHDVFRLNLKTGERTLVRTNDDNVVGWSLDHAANLRLGLRMTPNGGTEILRVDADALVPIYEVSADESCAPLQFTPDGTNFYLITNKGSKLDKMQLELFDPTSGKSKQIDKDPKNEVDLAQAYFSDLTNELLATVYIGDRVRIYPKEKKFAADLERLRKVVPDGELSLSSVSADENFWLVGVSSDLDPGSHYIFDRTTGKAELLYRSRPDIPTEDLAPMKPVRYKTREGAIVPAYLTLPKGIPAKNLPTVLLIHGGPWARDLWGYDAEAQFLANRGYAVLQPNFRGSTGYGKKFLNAGNKQWGTGLMQHDISDAVKYLIKQGISDPKRIAIYGGSYGGYATLAGMAFTPDLYAAGVSFVGPSNIITLLNSIPPYWAPIKKMFAVRVGDMENPKELKRLEEQSPLNSAKNIRAPLMVVQGANDPRVKKTESDQIVVALRDLGRPVEYMVAPDEGHGFLGKENRLAFYTAQEKFFAKYLGGREQESVSKTIQEKLSAIMVDVKTVTMPVRNASAEGEMPAFDGSKVKPYSAKYSAKMNIMGREMAIASTLNVGSVESDGRKLWRIVEESVSQMGSSFDTLDVDAATLLPVRRAGKQGMAKINISFTPSSVEGKILAGPQELPMNAKLSAPVLSEGAGVELAISTLPLTEGYKTTILAFDLMAAKEKKMLLAVIALERIILDGGTFDAFKIQLSAADGEGGTNTLWIDKQTRRVAKKETDLPVQMGGGKMVTEMVK